MSLTKKVNIAGLQCETEVACCHMDRDGNVDIRNQKIHIMVHIKLLFIVINKILRMFSVA